MFSEQESLVMIMTVVPEEKVEPILAGLRPLFARHSGVMFVADVAVSRREYFGKSLTGSFRAARNDVALCVGVRAQRLRAGCPRQPGSRRRGGH